MSVETDLVRYYAERARYYERVYHKPERQDDLAKLRSMVASRFVGKKVLEIACGTGYWTKLISNGAVSVCALDINEEVLALARSKPVASGKVMFRREDAYALAELPREFDAAVAGFWWSHVPKARLRGFLAGLPRALEPAARVMFFDNAYVAGSSTPLSRRDSDGNPISLRDADGNTYQQRVLDDGITHQILKNFPTAEELRTTVEGLGDGVEITFLRYYWILSYSILGV